MGRAPLGAAAKSKTGSVRVTVQESKYFEKHYGGLGRFLQLKVNEELNRVAQMQALSPKQELK